MLTRSDSALFWNESFTLIYQKAFYTTYYHFKNLDYQSFRWFSVKKSIYLGASGQLTGCILCIKVESQAPELLTVNGKLAEAAWPGAAHVPEANFDPPESLLYHLLPFWKLILIIL